MEKMENEKMRCWKMTQRKNEMETGDENRNITEREMVEQSEFFKQIEDETENLAESSNHINKNWINTAKDRGRWTLLEENYTKNSVTRMTRNSHYGPASYVNGVKLSDEEKADIT